MRLSDVWRSEEAPQIVMPPGRVRALLAEAALQQVDLRWLTSPAHLPIDGILTAEIWTEAEFERQQHVAPDVVLVVNPPRRVEEIAFSAWIARHSILVDDRAPDKLALARLLQAGPLDRYIIPFAELTALTMRRTLEHWLDIGEPCVVKPANGERGSNVQFLLPHADGTWTVHKDDTSHRCSPSEAVDCVCRRIAGRIERRTFLVQRYIASRTVDDRAFDIRVHVQRGAAGDWAVTRCYARIGEAGFIVSNVSRGGYQAQARSALARLRRRTPDAIMTELAHLAQDVACHIERHTGHMLSELGVDVALDEDGALWLIEANARPETSLHEHDRAIHTIGYAKYLARGRCAPSLSCAAD